MIIGIMVLGLSISTLGGALIESRFKKSNTEENQNSLKLKDDYINSDNNQTDNGGNNSTIKGITTSLIKKSLTLWRPGEKMSFIH